MHRWGLTLLYTDIGGRGVALWLLSFFEFELEHQGTEHQPEHEGTTRRTSPWQPNVRLTTPAATTLADDVKPHLGQPQTARNR